MKLEKFLSVFSVAIIVGTFLFFANNNYSYSKSPEQPSASKVAHAKENANPLTHNKKLVFGDEFDGSSLDKAKWATCYDWRKSSETGCTNHGNFEQQWYTEDQITVENGQLILIAEKGAIDVSVQNQAKSFAYTSGMVNSGRGSMNGSVRWAGTYGYYEARMKVQTGKGVWPAFWLLPIDREWPPEIDVMEFIGSKPGEILQTLHWQGQNKPEKSEAVIKDNEDYSTDWHTYGLDWRPEGIDWYIDGIKTRSYAGSNVPSKPMEIILNLAIGGLLPGNADATTPLNRELRVDYVRVYQSEDQVRPYQH